MERWCSLNRTQRIRLGFPYLNISSYLNHQDSIVRNAKNTQIESPKENQKTKSERFIHTSKSKSRSLLDFSAKLVISGAGFIQAAMATKSVKVNNVSLTATDLDLHEFFNFSGEIEYIEMQSENENSKTAYVTFKNPEGAETAVLLTGAMLAGQRISIELAPDYALPASVASAIQTAAENSNAEKSESGFRKAEDVVTSMLAKGFILGKDALNHAKAFDEKHQFTSTAAAKVVSLDQKIGFSEKLSIGTTLVNDKVKEMDQKYQVSEKTKSALSAAEQSVSNAGSAMMKNRYVLTGATWVTGAFHRVAKAAEEVGQKTREKVLAEDQGRVAQTQMTMPPPS